MEKKGRLLAIVYRLLAGESVSVAELADQYQVSGKSILRDFGEIRTFLAENRNLTGNLELVYDAKVRVYRLEGGPCLQKGELYAAIKILLGSRALEKQQISKIVLALTEMLPGKDRKVIRDNLYGDMGIYKAVAVDSADLTDKVWVLEEAVRTGRAIRISYQRLDEKRVERNLYPLGISFEEHYFYLMACRADIEESAVVYYRVDRILDIFVSSSRIPFHIEERRRKEAERMYAQNMFMGEKVKIRFRYTGPSVQAVLDRFPTAEIVKQDEDGFEIAAVVEYSRGTIMELLAQGRWVKVISPKRVIEAMSNEIELVSNYYRKIE